MVGAASILTSANAFAQALAALRKRVPMTDDEFAAVQLATHETAFKVAGVQQLDLVAEVWRQLDAAIAGDLRPGEWKKALADRLANAWSKSSKQYTAWRLDTIFRNGVQQSFNHGRVRQMEEPAMLEARPYWLYAAIVDSNTTPHCRDANGTCLPAEHDWWRSHACPAHHRCRATWRSLRRATAVRRGITRAPPATPAQSGFGAKPAPTPAPEPPAVDLSDYPAPLREPYQQKA